MLILRYLRAREGSITIQVLIYLLTSIFAMLVITVDLPALILGRVVAERAASIAVQTVAATCLDTDEWRDTGSIKLGGVCVGIAESPRDRAQRQLDTYKLVMPFLGSPTASIQNLPAGFRACPPPIPSNVTCGQLQVDVEIRTRGVLGLLGEVLLTSEARSQLRLSSSG